MDTPLIELISLCRRQWVIYKAYPATFPFLLRGYFTISPDCTPGSVSLGCFLCVCRSQIVREHLVRKRPDGQTGNDPAPEEIKCSTCLHSLGTPEWGARQTGTQEEVPPTSLRAAETWATGALLECREQEVPISMLWANRMKSDTTLPMLWKWTQSSLWIGVSEPQNLIM